MVALSKSLVLRVSEFIGVGINRFFYVRSAVMQEFGKFVVESCSLDFLPVKFVHKLLVLIELLEVLVFYCLIMVFLKQVNGLKFLVLYRNV